MNPSSGAPSVLDPQGPAAASISDLAWLLAAILDVDGVPDPAAPRPHRSLLIDDAVFAGKKFRSSPTASVADVTSNSAMRTVLYLRAIRGWPRLHWPGEAESERFFRGIATGAAISAVLWAWLIGLAVVVFG
jgi:hypothetical protein